MKTRLPYRLDDKVFFRKASGEDTLCLCKSMCSGIFQLVNDQQALPGPYLLQGNKAAEEVYPALPKMSGQRRPKAQAIRFATTNPDSTDTIPYEQPRLCRWPAYYLQPIPITADMSSLRRLVAEASTYPGARLSDGGYHGTMLGLLLCESSVPVPLRLWLARRSTMISPTPSMTSSKQMWLRISPWRTLLSSHRVAGVSLACRRFSCC